MIFLLLGLSFFLHSNAQLTTVSTAKYNFLAFEKKIIPFFFDRKDKMNKQKHYKMQNTSSLYITRNSFSLLDYSTFNIPSNYYAANLGFVCKKELQLEKMTKIPFRFRLGSLAYCDQLEGKK